MVQKVSDLILEKIPPQNLEAEMSVLGSMLIEEEAISRVVELLNETHFYKESHRKIFSAVINLYESGEAVDLITLTEKLKKDNSLEKIEGAAYLTILVNSVPTAANVVHYARIVKEKALLRSLIATCTRLITDGYENNQDVDELLDKAERAIFDITQRKIEGGFVQFKDIIKDSIETIDRLYQKKENVTGVPSSFHLLDVKTAGFQPSDLIIIAGRPSMGKSSLACCIMEHVGIEKNLPVAIFSLEMSKEQLVQRMLCSHARIDAHKVRTGYLSQSDWPRLTSAAGKLSEAPIFVDDTAGISVLELRAKARRLKAQYDIKLIILDYLQLMQGPRKSENRQQEISEISRSLKALAKELDIPLIAVSQLSRAVEARAEHRPQLSDLRESGSIEQDADLVLLLLREEYYQPTEENKGLSEIIIAKQRNGPIGSLKLAFIKEYTRFENLSPREE
ncbi:MAG: replicative DNA helicase [Candidatus Omnitrophota bacterium]|nr:replicative DNA helicase [Candidatus Omnitrophota bacterium]